MKKKLFLSRIVGDVPSHKFDMQTLPTDMTHKLQNPVKNSDPVKYFLVISVPVKYFWSFQFQFMNSCV